MAGKGGGGSGRRLWGAIFFMFLENIFSRYFLLLKGSAPFESMMFKADFLLSAFWITATYYYLISLLTPQWGIVAALHQLHVVTNECAIPFSWCQSMFDGWVMAALKWKCCHLNGISIAGCYASYQNDNFQCSQCWKFLQKDDIFVSVVCTLATLYELKHINL